MQMFMIKTDLLFPIKNIFYYSRGNDIQEIVVLGEIQEDSFYFVVFAVTYVQSCRGLYATHISFRQPLLISVSGLTGG